MIAIICVIIGMFFAAVGIDYIEEGTVDLALISLAIAVLSMLPLVLRIINIISSREAAELAQKLILVGDKAIGCAEFERRYRIQNTARKIERLSREKYLTGVAYDPSSDAIIFTERTGDEYKKRVYVCPNCGARGELEPNAPARCEYCGEIIESFLKI